MPPVSRKTKPPPSRVLPTTTTTTKRDVGEEAILFTGISSTAGPTGDSGGGEKKNKKTKRKQRKTKGKSVTKMQSDDAAARIRSEMPLLTHHPRNVTITTTSASAAAAARAEVTMMSDAPPPSVYVAQAQPPQDPPQDPPLATTETTTSSSAAAALNQSSSSYYTEASPFHQYLTQIENDYGVTSIESVGPNATFDHTEEEQEQEVVLQYPYHHQQSPHHHQQSQPQPHQQSFNNDQSFSDGSVSDMYAIAVMQYDPSAGGQYEDDISTLGDESMIRRRTLWTGTRSRNNSYDDGDGDNIIHGAQNLVDADDYENNVAVAEQQQKQKQQPPPPAKPKSKKVSKSAPKSSKKKSTTKGTTQKKKASPNPPAAKEDPSKMKEIRINKSKSRSGNTFLQTFFSNSYSNEEEHDGDNHSTPMSADVYTTVNEFATPKPDEEEGIHTMQGDVQNDDDDDDDDDDDKSVTFVQRNKWLIIRFMVCVSIFLLAVAAVALTFGVLYINDSSSSSTSSTFGSLFGKSNGNGDANPSEDSSSTNEQLPPAFAPPPSVFDLIAPTASPTVVEVLSPDAPQPPKPIRPKPDGSPVSIPPASATETPPTEDLGDVQFHFLSVLANHSSSSVDDLVMMDTDTATPQSLAYSWVLKDPMYWTYSNATILQRWVLAVFYYSTGGDQWATENFPVDFQLGKAPWMNYSDECQWESSNQGTDGEICDGDGELYAWDHSDRNWTLVGLAVVSGQWKSRSGRHASHRVGLVVTNGKGANQLQ
jgi:hypothetical protein